MSFLRLLNEEPGFLLLVVLPFFGEHVGLQNRAVV